MTTTAPFVARIGFDGKYTAAIAAGRMVSVDALQDTGAKVRDIANFVADWADDKQVKAVYIHTGGTEEEQENFDGFVGILLAATERDAGPLSVASSSLSYDSEALDTLLDALAEEFGEELFSEGEKGLFLVPGGWAVAALYPGEATYEPENQAFGEDAKAIVNAASEDMPPPAAIELAQLPERVWLYASYC